MGAGGFEAPKLPAGLHFTGDADEDAAMLEALEVLLLTRLTCQRPTIRQGHRTDGHAYTGRTENCTFCVTRCRRPSYEQP